MSAEKTPPPPLRKPPGFRDPNMKIHHHQPPQSLKRRRACCRSCCCCFCIGLIILLLVSISAGLTLYLWFQPRLPQIHLKSVAFSNFNVTTTPDGPVLDAASTLAFEIRNPNQNLGIVYERSHVLLSAVNGDVSLGERRVAGFSQGRDDVTVLKLVMKVEKEIVDGKSAEELMKGFKSRNLVVSAEIRSGIEVRHGRWATAPVEVVVECGGVKLSVVERGSGSMPKCRIKMFNWYVCFYGSCY